MKVFLYLFSLCLISFQAFSQQFAVSEIPTELKSRASAIVREELFVLDMKNEKNISQTVKKVITIFNQSGQNHSELMLFYDKSKSIKDIKGIIYNEFGMQVSKFGNKDFKDYSATGQVNMYDDIRVKHYSPNVLTYPYTIEYTYEIKHSQNLFIPYWRPNYAPDLAIEKSTYQFTCKPDLALRIKTENLSQPAQEETTDKFKTYTWSVSNINARKQEPYSPVTYNKEIIVKIVPEKFQYFKRDGDVKDWNDFGKWVYDQLLFDKHDLSQETKDKVKALTAHITDPREKAKILYEYMQNKTRYISIQIGIGGLEPFPASYVDRLGYGDCKALVNYMQALLSEAGVPSLYCVVEAGNSKIDLDESFANAVDGNHIILCIPFENDTTWLECTSNRSPFGYLGTFTDDRLVLACTPEGGKVLRTTSYPYATNQQIRKGTLHVSKEGNVTGEIKTTFTGSQFDNHFDNKFNNPSEQVKTLKKYYDINNITFDKYAYIVNNVREPQLIEDLSLTINNYVVKNGNQLIFQPNLLNTLRAIPDSKNRINELYINRGFTDIDELEYSLESKLKGTIVPIDKVIESPMGKYILKVYNDGDKIKMYRHIEIKEGTYPAEDYQKYYDFMREVSSMDRVKYTLNVADTE